MAKVQNVEKAIAIDDDQATAGPVTATTVLNDLFDHHNLWNPHCDRNIGFRIWLNQTTLTDDFNFPYKMLKADTLQWMKKKRERERERSHLGDIIEYAIELKTASYYTSFRWLETKCCNTNWHQNTQTSNLSMGTLVSRDHIMVEMGLRKDRPWLS